MKPAPFAYHAPASVGDCLRTLEAHGPDAKLLAGGQSLVPLMNLRLAAPEVLVDLNRVAGLDHIQAGPEQLTIGAMTRHRDVAGAAAVQAASPLLSAAARHVGYPAIRVRGTLGGSLAHADPASELACAAVTLDAEIVVAASSGRRTIAARDFFRGHFSTALEPAELLLEVHVPRRRPGDGWAFAEFSRKSGDFAVVAAAIDVRIRAGRVERARIGLAGVADRPVRATAAEAALTGAEPVPAALRAAGERAGAAVEDDYRGHVAATLVARALQDAVAEAER